MNLIVCLLACLLIVPACNDDNELGNNKQAFGYIQLKIRKAQSKAITGGSELENLKDAKKVQIDLLVDNRQITQTLNLQSVSEEAAEFGLTSESMQLLSGEYTLTGYRIYGEYIEGTTEGDSAPILQEGEPDEPMYFTVNEQQLTTVTLDVVAQLKGKLSLIIGKDFSNIQPTKAGYNPDDFNYNNIASLQIDMKAGISGQTREYVLKTWRGKNDYLYHTDTLSLRVNDYTINQVRFLDKNKKLIMVIDAPANIKIENQILSKDTVSIDMPLTPAFRDYIALYNIWKKMDGENWYWNGQGINEGANWLFKYSDGTPRPLDLWGSQPAVNLDAKGRVTVLNLGGFNAKGFVPDEIGELEELQSLFLGNHSDAAQIDPNLGMMIVDKYELARTGVDIFANRMAIAKEALALRHPSKASKLAYKSASADEPMKYAKPYYSHDYTGYSNRITGISEAIGKCKNLSMLSIANGLITELPSSLADLDNLTDLEIYSVTMPDIPECVTRMKSLVAFNFSRIKGLDNAKFIKSFAALCDGPAKATIQMIYMNENLLTELPANLGNLKNLGLLDFSTNRITKLPPLGKDVSLVQLLIDDNRVTEIPENWFNPDDLEKFSADNNQITVFPNMFSAKSLYQVEELNLEGNKINRFADGFKGINVEKLNLNSNKFTKLPVEFANTGSTVNFLRLGNNQIDSIPPASITNFKSLKALEILGNKLKYIPYQFNVENMPYLTGVDLSFNQFARFPYNVLYCQLAELRIASQFDYTTGKKSLTEWPDNIEQQPTLRVLDISSNDVRTVKNFPVMLNYLDIHGNPNIRITVPESILYRIMVDQFKFIFDKDQDIQGI